MISLHGDNRIFMALGPTDMHKGFYALAVVVTKALMR
jgi:hypothetical protein